MSPIRFELDKRAFGVVRFPRQHMTGAQSVMAVKEALSQSLGIKLSEKRLHLFGPKVLSFDYRGEKIALKFTKSGEAILDLGVIDDESREILLEHLRHSYEFTSS